LPRIEHFGVLVLEIGFFDCRAGRMLACPGTASNKAREHAFPDSPERQRGDCVLQTAEAAA